MTRKFTKGENKMRVLEILNDAIIEREETIEAYHEHVNELKEQKRELYSEIKRLKDKLKRKAIE